MFADQPGMLLVVEKYPGQSTVRRRRAGRRCARAAGARPRRCRPSTPRSTSRRSTSSARSTRSSWPCDRRDPRRGLLLGLFLEWRSALVAGISAVVSGAVAVMVLYIRQATINSMVVAGLVLAIVLVVDDAIVGVGGITQPTAGPWPGQRRVLDADGPDPRRRVRSARASAVCARHHRRRHDPAPVVDGLAAESFLPVDRDVLPAGGRRLVGRRAHARAGAEPRDLRALTARRRANPGRPHRARGLSEVRTARTAAAGRCSPLPATRPARWPSGSSASPNSTPTPCPSFRETDLLVQVQASPGTSLEAMERIATTMNGELMTVEGVRRVGSHLGRAITSDQVVERQLRRALGTRRRRRRLRPGDQRDQSGDRRVPGCARRAADLHRRAAGRRDRAGPGTDRRPDLRRGSRHPDCQGRRGQGARLAGIDGIADPQVVIAPNEPSYGSRSISMRRRRSASFPATSAGRRPRCCRGSRSATCSRTSGCSRSSCSALPSYARA